MLYFDARLAVDGMGSSLSRVSTQSYSRQRLVSRVHRKLKQEPLRPFSTRKACIGSRQSP